MGSVRRRLNRLEDLGSDEGRPRSPEHVYDRIRREAQESIEESLEAGEDPLYRITDEGEVETANGKRIDHYGDFIRPLDERIAQLDQEIAELEKPEKKPTT